MLQAIACMQHAIQGHIGIVRQLILLQRRSSEVARAPVADDNYVNCPPPLPGNPDPPCKAWCTVGSTQAKVSLESGNKLKTCQDQMACEAATDQTPKITCEVARCARWCSFVEHQALTC